MCLDVYTLSVGTFKAGVPGSHESPDVGAGNCRELNLGSLQEQTTNYTFNHRAMSAAPQASFHRMNRLPYWVQ